MVGGMMSPEAFALVSTILWETAERMGEFFMVPITAITDTDQSTAKQRLIAMKTRETNDDSMNMGVRYLTPIKIYDTMQKMYGTPGPQEKEDSSSTQPKTDQF